MTDDVQEFCLRWNNHQSNLVSAFYDLKLGEDFVDVTLACEGRYLQAHKVVLSACSPFFREILKATPCKHPVIVLKDILYNDLVCLIEFIYMGEVRVKHHGLSSFLNTAEVLRVRGLAEPSAKYKTSLLPCSDGCSSPVPPRLPNVVDSDPCPPFSTHLNDVLQAPLQPSSIPSPGGIGMSFDAMGSPPRGFPSETKVEDIDLMDSGEEEEEDDDEDGMVRTSSDQMDGAGPGTEPEAGLDSGEDGQGFATGPVHAVPSLTFQSFARIPALTPLASRPPLNEENLATSHDVISAAEADHASGRPSGRMSSSDRPRWPCPFCLRLLSSRSSVRRHIEDRHTNDTSRHPCPLCERLYRTRNSLQYHLSTAHRDREPGPRGRPRTRPRTPSSIIATTSTAESALPVDNNGLSKNSLSSSMDPPDVGCLRTNNNNNPSSTLLVREMMREPPPPPFGLPPT